MKVNVAFVHSAKFTKFTSVRVCARARVLARERESVRHKQILNSVSERSAGRESVSTRTHTYIEQSAITEKSPMQLTRNTFTTIRSSEARKSNRIKVKHFQIPKQIYRIDQVLKVKQ